MIFTETSPGSLAAQASVAAFLVTLATVPPARWLAKKLGIVDKPGHRKVHKDATPMMGGLGLLLGLLAGVSIAGYHGLLGAFGSSYPLQGVVYGAVLIFTIGLLDDRFGVTPKWKFIGQGVVAVLLVAFEIRVSLFIRDNLITTIITMIWLVGIMNSFNLLDNMNGLSTGVGLIAAATFGWIAHQQHDAFVLGLAAALAGACAGFLPYNFPKASIFLGDAGSMLIGFVLAAISVQGIYLQDTKLTHLPVITPLIVLGVPLFDTISVILIRLARGKPLFVGDKNHFSHRLVDLGMTHTQAVLVIFLVAIAISIPATLLSRVTLREAVMLMGQEIILFIIIVALMRAGMVREEENAQGLPRPDHEDDQAR